MPLPAVLFLFVALLASRGLDTLSLSAQSRQRRSRFSNISRDSPWEDGVALLSGEAMLQQERAGLFDQIAIAFVQPQPAFFRPEHRVCRAGVMDRAARGAGERIRCGDRRLRHDWAR